MQGLCLKPFKITKVEFLSKVRSKQKKTTEQHTPVLFLMHVKTHTYIVFLVCGILTRVIRERVGMRRSASACVNSSVKQEFQRFLHQHIPATPYPDYLFCWCNVCVCCTHKFNKAIFFIWQFSVLGDTRTHTYILQSQNALRSDHPRTSSTAWVVFTFFA